jgi:hypothetical protein
MNRTSLVILASAALAACATTTVPPPPPPPQEATSFHAENFAWSAQAGTASVSGSVVYRSGGQRFSCATQPVILIPDEPYSRGRIATLYGSADKAVLTVAEVRSRQAGRPRDEYSAFVRSGSCDAAGRFQFQGLPAGGWFLVAVARPDKQGEPLAMMKRVAVRAGEARAVVLP